MEDNLRFAVSTFGAVIIFLIALGGSFLPRFLFKKGEKKYNNNNNMYIIILRMGNIFSGGVMLSAGLVHLLGEAVKRSQNSENTNYLINLDFPVAPFLTASGCLLTFTVNVLVQVYLDNRSQKQFLNQRGEFKYFNRNQQQFKNEQNSTVQNLNQSEQQQLQLQCSQQKCNIYGNYHYQILEQCDSSQRVDISQKKVDNKNSHKFSEQNENQVSNSLNQNNRDKKLEIIDNQSEMKLIPDLENQILKYDTRYLRSFDDEFQQQQYLSDCSHVVHMQQQNVSCVAGMVLAIALTLHSVLEGAALGAQERGSQMGEIFLAILAHKGLAAFALGATLLQSNPSDVRFWTSIITFSLASPIGVFIGYIISELNGSTSLILSALAGGTFLYVALMEVIPKEMAVKSYRAWKMVGLWGGFIVTSVLAIWI